MSACRSNPDASFNVTHWKAPHRNMMATTSAERMRSIAPAAAGRDVNRGICGQHLLVDRVLAEGRLIFTKAKVS